MRRLLILLLAAGFSLLVFAHGERRRNYATREIGFIGNTSYWWDVPGAPAEIASDPVVTFVELFWLDELGFICHGNPGVSGQPGFFELPYPAWDELESFSNNRREIFLPEEALLHFQMQRYPVPLSYNGLGDHIIIFWAHQFRLRSTGQILQTLHSELSRPLDMMVEETFLVPGYVEARTNRYMTEREDCPLLGEFGVALPPPPSFGASDEPAQHPSRCLVRSNVRAEDLVIACQNGRLRGSLSGEKRLTIVKPEQQPRFDLKKPGKKDIKKTKKQKYL